MDEHPTVFVGIDVSKDRLDVHLRPSDETFHVPRDAKGLEGLARRFGNLSVAVVVLEATGGFEASVAAALAAVSLPLCIVNPRQISPAQSQPVRSLAAISHLPSNSAVKPCTTNVQETTVFLTLRRNRRPGRQNGLVSVRKTWQ